MIFAVFNVCVTACSRSSVYKLQFFYIYMGRREVNTAVLWDNHTLALGDVMQMQGRIRVNILIHTTMWSDISVSYF